MTTRIVDVRRGRRRRKSRERAQSGFIRRRTELENASAAFICPAAEHSLFRCGELRRTAARRRTRVRRAAARTRKSPISKGEYGWAKKRRTLDKQSTNRQDGIKKWDKGESSRQWFRSYGILPPCLYSNRTSPVMRPSRLASSNCSIEVFLDDLKVKLHSPPLFTAATQVATHANGDFALV